MLECVERTSYLAEAPVAVVIGCGDMGMGCARTLGLRHPLLVVDVDNARMEEAIATLRFEGYTVSGMACDITDPADVERVAQAVSGGGVRVLAHVAAIGKADAGWRRVVEVDLNGMHLVAHALAPHFVRGGVAILISSVGSYLCPASPRIDSLLDAPLEPGFFDALAEAFGREPTEFEAYCLAKQGVNRLAERLAIDWGKNEVRAVSISVGMINSTMGRGGGSQLPRNDGSPQSEVIARSEKVVRELPLARQGSPLEIRSVVEFVASDGASFLTGIDIPVDGGQRAQWRNRGVVQR